MNSPDQKVLFLLRAAPHSIVELVETLKLPHWRIMQIVASLIEASDVRRLEGRTDEGRPCYCASDYREDVGRRDHADVILGRDYGQQYTRPVWADEL